MKIESKSNDTNSTMMVLDFSLKDDVSGFTFESSSTNGHESPCKNRQSLKVEDFKCAFTKSSPARCPTQ